MSARFADSFVFLAMVNPRDRKHAAAVQALDAPAGPLVTTAWVLTELADGLCAPRSRPIFLALEARLRGHPLVTIVPPQHQPIPQPLLTPEC